MGRQKTRTRALDDFNNIIKRLWHCVDTCELLLNMGYKNVDKVREGLEASIAMLEATIEVVKTTRDLI